MPVRFAPGSKPLLVLDDDDEPVTPGSGVVGRIVTGGRLPIGYYNDPEKTAVDIEKHVIQTLRNFSSEHLCKFLGAGVTLTLLKEVSLSCTRSSLSLLIKMISPPIYAHGCGWTWT